MFDVSNQPEKLKNTSINAQIKMTFAANPLDNTVAYAVTYSDDVTQRRQPDFADLIINFYKQVLYIDDNEIQRIEVD